ncbi:MAG: toll/interleukin-1 receptor domain-containing protein [Methylococcales bacterium]
MSDIFLCYSRTDSQLAGQLEQRLKAEGWSVYRDVQTLVGRRWHKEIEKELHAARSVVVLWSEHSRESDYVLEEAEYGERKDILFPAFIKRASSPDEACGIRDFERSDVPVFRCTPYGLLARRLSPDVST